VGQRGSARTSRAVTAALAAAGLALLASPAAAGSSSPTWEVPGFFDGSPVIEGAFVIPEGTIWEDDLVIHHGTLTVRGLLEGAVLQRGKGGVYVAKTGEVTGSIYETGSGGVRISGISRGVYEKGTGSVIVHSTGSVSGEIVEDGSAGNIDIRGKVSSSSTDMVGVGIQETGAGHIWLRSSTRVSGLSVLEQGAGNLYLYRGAKVDGLVTETGPGALVRP